MEIRKSNPEFPSSKFEEYEEFMDEESLINFEED